MISKKGFGLDHRSDRMADSEEKALIAALNHDDKFPLQINGNRRSKRL
jgi:hypothetical protein